MEDGLLGRSINQVDVFNDSESFCAAKLKEDSIYSFLRRERNHLFPDDAFEDLYDECFAHLDAVTPWLHTSHLVTRRA